MARREGSLDMGQNIEPKLAASLDARKVVTTTAELTAEGNFKYGYNGLRVSVEETGRVYVLIDRRNPTKEESWRELATVEDIEPITEEEIDEIIFG